MQWKAWKGRSEAIMVDYHTAVETVRNPHADPVMLARIAYENPEFGANVAANPRAYPGLIHWLAQFGDARARAYIREGRLDTIADDMGAGNTNVDATVTGRQTPKRRNRWTPQRPSADEPSPILEAEERRTAATTPTTTNPYGFTVEQARDPRTDAMTIAAIAQYAPELRPYLARNPSTYPELMQWLADLHDPRIDDALAAREHRREHHDPLSHNPLSNDALRPTA